MMMVNRIAYLFLLVGLFLFSANGWAQQTSTSAGSSPKTTGSITGRVVTSTGEPLAGASVSVFSVAPGSRPQVTNANSNGEFTMDGLPAALYRVYAGMPGYVSAPQATNESALYFRIGDTVTLTMIKGAVITGTVTGPGGPLVGAGVFATRVRDQEGKKVPASLFRERRTDDRGAFRIYGLPPGAYLISVGKPRTGLVAPSAYDSDSPTYFPSATRDTASEIAVRDGEEATADIRYRANPGYAVSGRVSGILQNETSFANAAQVSLVDVRTRAAAGSGAIRSSSDNNFAIIGVPDGEYELSATQYLPTGDQMRSGPRRITVRGADVTGIDLSLGLLGSIEGRLVFENDPKAACGKRKETAPRETMMSARRYALEKNPDPRANTGSAPVPVLPYSSFAVADAKGSFTLRNLQGGSYRVAPHVLADGWFIKSLAVLGQSGAPRIASLAAAKDGISLKNGERVTGLVVTITEGAAHLHGHVSAGEGRTMPSGLGVYLVPAEREAADNVLRFYETRAQADRTFTLDNLNPGKYFIMLSPIPEDESGLMKSIRLDSALRNEILKNATAAGKEILFKPCGDVADYELSYQTSLPATKP
jgi:hypothetical protein